MASMSFNVALRHRQLETKAAASQPMKRELMHNPRSKPLEGIFWGKYSRHARIPGFRAHIRGHTSNLRFKVPRAQICRGAKGEKPHLQRRKGPTAHLIDTAGQAVWCNSHNRYNNSNSRHNNNNNN